MFNFKKLIISLFSIFTLFLVFSNSSTVEAVKYSENINDWNSSALNAFGISNDYFNNYFEMNRSLVDSNMTTSEINQLEKDGLLMFAYEDIIGHSYPSDVNSSITIHFVGGTNDGYEVGNNTYADFQVVSSGGSWAVDKLFLAYISDLSQGLNAEVYKSGEKLTQPKITVKNDNVEVYIPYIYHSTNERKYYAQQLSNKLEVLTGKKFNVTIYTSNKSTVQAFDKKYGCNTLSDSKYIYGKELSSFISNNEAVNLRNKTTAFNSNSIYSDGKYLANPNLIILHNTKFSDFLNLYANQWHNGVSAYTQRFILGNLIWNLFFSAKVERVVFDDYTITLRAGKYLDIESSEYYLGYYYNEGIIK